MSESKIANTEQAEFWETEAGQQWVDGQERFDSFLQPVLDQLLEMADLKLGHSVLDIGCGTGASPIAAARLVGADGRVDGLDISSTLLALAGKRVAAEGLNNVNLSLGDAQVHSFGAAQYDRVISRFGVMFFEDTPAAFANIARSVRPGGTMTFASWGPMAANPWFSVPCTAAIQQLGEIPPVDPYAPGPMAFHDTGRVLDYFHKAGLTDVKATVVDSFLGVSGSVEEAARQTTNVGPARRIMDMKGASEVDAEAIVQTVARAYSGFATADGISVPVQLNYFQATIA